MKETILGFITAFAVVLITTPSLIKVAHMKNLVDEPNEARKKHRGRIPTIGGVILFAASIFAYSLWFPWDDRLFFGGLHAYEEAVKTFKFTIAALVLIFFIGVKDDIIGVAPLKKLGAHVIVGFILVFMADLRITGMQGLLGIDELPYAVSVGVSVFTYIVVVNAFNLIDGSDGLAAGTGVIASCAFGLWFFVTRQHEMALLAFVVSGALLAFLGFNFSPARIFMGDSGSLFIGAVTFIMAIKCVETRPEVLTGLKPIVNPAVFAVAVLSYPLTDTLSVFTIRVVRGVSPFRADRNHLHHCLIDRGYTHAETAIAFYLFSAIVASLSLLFGGVSIHIAMGGVLCIIGIFVVLIRNVPPKRRQALA